VKKRLLVYGLLLLSGIARAQPNTGYVLPPAIPDSLTYSTSNIARYINSHYQHNADKLQAAYRWITSHIQYNKDSMYYRFWGEDPDRKLSSVLKNRKGVCENFASLLSRIAEKCGIKTYVVNGYTKTNGSINWAGHSWCAVQLDGEWLLCDPTWDAGNQQQFYYYLLPAQTFIHTHMPFDYLWQLMEYPITHKAFKQGNDSKKKQEPFLFKDSVAQYLASDTLQQMEAISRRMKQQGLENDELRTWYAYNEMKLFIVYQEGDMIMFNQAVANLNTAKKYFNEYIHYRNNRFIPARPDAAINQLFTTIETLLKTAYQQLQQIGTRVENYQYDTEGLQGNLDNFASRVKNQRQFLQRYFAASQSERQQLLYQ
jgi:hypothetical protein